MIDSTQQIVDGLKKALETEANGMQFYTMVADKTDDPDGKKTFKILADEEQKHLNYLSAQLKSISETGNVDTTIELGEQYDYSSNPIFSSDLISRAGKAQFEMSALSMGMQLEKSAIEYYSEQSKLASDSGLQEVADFYLDLVKWEERHLEALSRHHESLREDFWAKGGFAPF